MGIWTRFLCLRCLMEIIVKERPNVCPFCLADEMYLRFVADLVHNEPGKSDECPGYDSAH